MRFPLRTIVEAVRWIPQAAADLAAARVKRPTSVVPHEHDVRLLRLGVGRRCDVAPASKVHPGNDVRAAAGRGVLYWCDGNMLADATYILAYTFTVGTAAEPRVVDRWIITRVVRRVVMDRRHQFDTTIAVDIAEAINVLVSNATTVRVETGRVVVGDLPHERAVLAARRRYAVRPR